MAPLHVGARLDVLGAVLIVSDKCTIRSASNEDNVGGGGRDLRGKEGSRQSERMLSPTPAAQKAV